MKSNLKMNNKIIYGFLLVLPFLLESCQQKEVEQTLLDDSPTVTVNVQVVDADKGAAYFMASGKVEAAKTVNVSTRMMGYVEQVNTKVGDRVRKGQLLGRFQKKPQFFLQC